MPSARPATLGCVFARNGWSAELVDRSAPEPMRRHLGPAVDEPRTPNRGYTICSCRDQLGECVVSERSDERWFRVMVRNGAQTCCVLALGRSETDAERTVREEIPLYQARITWIEPVGDRRVVTL